MQQFFRERPDCPSIIQPDVQTHPSSPLTPPVIQLPLSSKSRTPRKESSPGYSLGIMRLHPLTADLEHVASSSNVSSPPRAPFRSGLVPSSQEDEADVYAEGILNACAQPAFRVAIPTAQNGVALDTRLNELDATRRHRCPQCGKAFNRPSSLVTHVNMHTGAKRTSCPPSPAPSDAC